jgi:hypothetical protein
MKQDKGIVRVVRPSILNMIEAIQEYANNHRELPSLIQIPIEYYSELLRADCVYQTTDGYAMNGVKIEFY